MGPLQVERAPLDVDISRLDPVPELGSVGRIGKVASNKVRESHRLGFGHCVLVDEACVLEVAKTTTPDTVGVLDLAVCDDPVVFFLDSKAPGGHEKFYRN